MLSVREKAGDIVLEPVEKGFWEDCSEFTVANKEYLESVIEDNIIIDLCNYFEASKGSEDILSAIKKMTSSQLSTEPQTAVEKNRLSS